MIKTFITIILFSELLGFYCEPETSFIDLVSSYGFKTYLVTTEDKYNLKLFRVQKNGSFDRKKRTVLLVHGLADSADSWALNKNYNMVQAFVEEDWDVWILNNRGNKYSCTHKTLNPDQKEFWAYSFQHMAAYDIPAIVDFIYNSVQMPLTLVGHSQGTTQIFAALSENQNLSQKVEKVMALAPVAFMIGFKESKSFYNFIATHQLVHTLNFLGYNSFFDGPLDSNKLMDYLIKFFCVNHHSICNFFISSFSDKNPDNLDPEGIELFLKRYPAEPAFLALSIICN